MGRLSRAALALGAATLALCGTAPVRAQESPSLAEQVVALVNQRRAEAGLHPLRVNAQLQQAAQRYAQYMADTNTFSHTGSDGSTPYSRMAAAGYRGTMMGENIARGFGSASSVMDAWMNSSGHRANILNPGYTELGVGVAAAGPAYVWVQNFGASDYDGPPPPNEVLPPNISGLSPLTGRLVIRSQLPVSASAQRAASLPSPGVGRERPAHGATTVSLSPCRKGR
jgi:hypothetical protein